MHRARSQDARPAITQIEAAAQGQNFGANLSLKARGNRQNITIRTAGTGVKACHSRRSGASASLDRPDVAQARLRQRHAVGDVTRLAAIHVQRKHGLRAALLGPADHPAERWLAALGAEKA